MVVAVRAVSFTPREPRSPPPPPRGRGSFPLTPSRRCQTGQLLPSAAKATTESTVFESTPEAELTTESTVSESTAEAKLSTESAVSESASAAEAELTTESTVSESTAEAAPAEADCGEAVAARVRGTEGAPTGKGGSAQRQGACDKSRGGQTNRYLVHHDAHSTALSTPAFRSEPSGSHWVAVPVGRPAPRAPQPRTARRPRGAPN
jgi:hypothetical protein